MLCRIVVPGGKHVVAQPQPGLTTGAQESPPAEDDSTNLVQDFGKGGWP
jgi:hypothetical protein